MAIVSGAGLVLDLGALRVRVRSHLPEFVNAFASVYRHHPLITEPTFVDIDAQIRGGRGLHRWVRRQVLFQADGVDVFEPEPVQLALPHFEWGVNWCFGQIASRHLLLHSGAVEFSGVGVLLAAAPGSGKSTLTAALGLRGGRVLSDEFGVIRRSDLRLLSLAKPAVLKNRSIDVIREWASEATIGPVCENTRKGTVAHLAVSQSSVRGRHIPVTPRLVLFPRWREGAALSLRRVGSATAFTLLGTNSFNFSLLGPQGFDAVLSLVDSCACYEIEYGRLEDVVPVVIQMSQELAEGNA